MEASRCRREPEEHRLFARISLLLHHFVYGTLVDARAVGAMHFPTRRLPLELILSSLVVEWGVRPLAAGWHEILLESMRGFEERQTAA
jgi:hypothetical protein